MSSAPLKASSLSELRDLQRQAAKQTSLKAQAGHPPLPGHGSSSDRAVATTQTRRRPHRFLPPSLNSSLEARSGAKAGARSGSSSSSSSGPAPGPSSDQRPAHGADAARAEGAESDLQQFKAHSATPHAAENPLDDDDVALFRRVVQSVTPAAASNRALLPPVPSASPSLLKQRREHAMGQAVSPALQVSDQYASAGIDHDDTAYLQAGQGPHLIKGLRKGKWQVQASLDLHGSNLDEARERMDRFLLSCSDHQIRCVRIVHGKGYGSKNGDPVLKDTVRRWLSQLAVVQAYIESDEANGGAGAVLVLLSKNKP